MHTLILCFHTFHLLPTPLFAFFIGLCIPRGKDIIVVFRFIIESIVVVAYGIDFGPLVIIIGLF